MRRAAMATTEYTPQVHEIKKMQQDNDVATFVWRLRGMSITLIV